MEPLNLTAISHNLRLNGATAYRATLLVLLERCNELQEQVEELQEQLSAEIMARLGSPKNPAIRPRQREVIEDLGPGWCIESQPPNPPGSISITGTPADSWLADDWVTQYVATVEGY